MVIVTAEPYPQRIASLALGTGDIDCVYHFALPELQAVASEKSNPAILDMLLLTDDLIDTMLLIAYCFQNLKLQCCNYYMA